MDEYHGYVVSRCLGDDLLVSHFKSHEILPLGKWTVWLENATDDRVEVVADFYKKFCQRMGRISPRALSAIFDNLQFLYDEADLDKRVK